jgi:cytoskeletal protein RodZ
METNASSNEPTKPAPSSRRNRNIVIIVVVVVIAIVAIVFVANAIIQSQPQSQSQATANIQVTSFAIDQSVSGPTTVTVQVSNYGSASGSGTVHCSIDEGTGAIGAYTNSQAISIDPGSSRTVTIVVATPYGTSVTKSMCSVYFA